MNDDKTIIEMVTDDAVDDNSLFVSDVLTKEVIKNFSQKTFIAGGVGSGKNRWATTILTQGRKVLIITSRKAVKDQTKNEYKDFQTYVSHNEENGKVIITNALMAIYVKTCHEPMNIFRGDDGDFIFDFIVVDEAHSLFTDATFETASFYVWAFIQYVLTNQKSTKVVLMSATIFPISNKLIEQGWDCYDLLDKCKNLKPKRIQVLSKEIATFIITKTLSSENKAVYMATSANVMAKTTYKIFTDLGISKDRIALIMSDTRRDEIYNKKNMVDSAEMEKSAACYDSIITSGILPKEIDLVLTTSRLREGVNIKDKAVKMMFVESHNKIDIIQFAGRARQGVDYLYIIDSKKQHKSEYSRLEYEYSESETQNANAYLEKLVSMEEMFDCDKENYLNIPKLAEFIDFIEVTKQFEFIRFNPFIKKFVLYGQRMEGNVLNDKFLRQYDNDTSEYIKTFYGKSPVLFRDDCVFIVNAVIKNKKLLDKELTKIEIKDLLALFTKFGIVTKKEKQPYKGLSNLLQVFGYKIESIKGHNGKGRIVACDSISDPDDNSETDDE